jgi:hypothetical protein
MATSKKKSARKPAKKKAAPKKAAAKKKAAPARAAKKAAPKKKAAARKAAPTKAAPKKAAPAKKAAPKRSAAKQTAVNAKKAARQVQDSFERQPRAFIEGKTTTDALAEELGEDAVRAMTSGEDEMPDPEGERVAAVGGPFVVTSSVS